MEPASKERERERESAWGAGQPDRQAGRQAFTHQRGREALGKSVSQDSLVGRPVGLCVCLGCRPVVCAGKVREEADRHTWVGGAKKTVTRQPAVGESKGIAGTHDKHNSHQHIMRT